MRRTRRTEPGRRDRLVDVTLEIIAHQGLAGATYRTIADLAGVPLGSMPYHFRGREDLVFAAFEPFANESFSCLDGAVADVDTDSCERLARMIVADSPERKRDRVLLAELYVLAFRQECYAELMRQWIRRSKDDIERDVDGVSGHVIDAVQQGLTLQRHFLPEEFGEDVVRHTLRRASSRRRRHHAVSAVPALTRDVAPRTRPRPALGWTRRHIAQEI